MKSNQRSPAYYRGSTSCESSFHCTGFPQRGTLSSHRHRIWLRLPSSASLYLEGSLENQITKINTTARVNYFKTKQLDFFFFFSV